MERRKKAIRRNGNLPPSALGQTSRDRAGEEGEMFRRFWNET
jgi:hypothetical protein